MAYTAFDLTKPDGSTQAGSAFSVSANANDKALLDMIGGLLMPGFALTTRTGTDEPTVFLFTSGTRYFRVTLTWSSHRIATIKFELSTNSGVAYDQIGSTAAVSYDGSGNVTGCTNLAGVWLTFFEIWGKYIALKTATDAHAALTASVHGIPATSPIAAQQYTAVNIDGGTIDATTIGSSTPAAGNFTRATEKANATQAPGAGVGVALNWANGASNVTYPGSGTNAITFSNVPASGNVATHAAYLSNFNGFSFPAAVTWGAGGEPSIAGAAIVQFVTMDGGTTVYAIVAWRAV